MVVPLHYNQRTNTNQLKTEHMASNNNIKSVNDLKNCNCVDAAPNGIRGTFRRNPNKGGKWQHVNSLYYGGRNNSYAAYSDAEIFASLC
jgi:hypothetical protein